MAKKAAVLGIHLLDQQRGPTHVGTLTRDTSGAVAFAVAESYIQDPARPILSLGWHDPLDDDATRQHLATRGDKISLHGSLPPWFSGLLPEGDRKSTRLNSSHKCAARMPSAAGKK